MHQREKCQLSIIIPFNDVSQTTHNLWSCGFCHTAHSMFCTISPSNYTSQLLRWRNSKAVLSPIKLFLCHENSISIGAFCFCVSLLCKLLCAVRMLTFCLILHWCRPTGDVINSFTALLSISVNTNICDQSDRPKQNSLSTPQCKQLVLMWPAHTWSGRHRPNANLTCDKLLHCGWQCVKLCGANSRKLHFRVVQSLDVIVALLCAYPQWHTSS